MENNIDKIKEKISKDRKSLNENYQELMEEIIKLLSQKTIKHDLELDCVLLDIPKHLVKVQEIYGNVIIKKSYEILGYNATLTKLPDWLSKVTIFGDFNCSGLGLETLENCPLNVYGNLNCSFNKLTSLKGCSKNITGNLDCSYNYLTSLEYSPILNKQYKK